MNASQSKIYAEPMVLGEATATLRSDHDADVLALLHADNRTDAVRQLMMRHSAAVYRYCRVALRDAALADDIHQQVFIEAYRNLARFGGRSTLRTWLLGIARHRVLDAVKMRRRKEARLADASPIELVAVADPCPSPIESLDDRQQREALVACVDELAPTIRTALLLHYQQGLTYEEMAEICDEKPGTLQARVARGLRVLRHRIEARLANPGRTAPDDSPRDEVDAVAANAM